MQSQSIGTGVRFRAMINGVHSILYAQDVEKVRAFFSDVLMLKHVDVGHGWLVYALPPAELGVHPAEDADGFRCEMYLMCDDIAQAVTELKAKDVECSEIMDRGWGLMSMIKVPGGGQLGVYQPRHLTAINRL